MLRELEKNAALGDGYVGGWTIEKRYDVDGLIPRTSASIDDINALPILLLQLHDMGYDLTKTTEVIHEIEEEQRKRKVAEEARVHLKAAAEKYIQTPADYIDDERPGVLRRFVVAYAKEYGVTEVAEGIEYSNGKVYIDGSRYPVHGLKESRRAYEEVLERNGYSYYVQYID